VAEWTRNPGPRLAAAAALAGLLAAGGCDATNAGGPVDPNVEVPYPVSLTLPASIHIQPFTGMRTFDEAGGVSGLEVLVTPEDAFGDPTKAFGTFRFELYEFRRNHPDPKGRRRLCWEQDVAEPKRNRVHWDVSLAYRFRLRLDQAIPVGQRFVLVAIFSSPFTDRLFDERQFVAGE
jgi:hypothetical protein